MCTVCVADTFKLNLFNDGDDEDSMAAVVNINASKVSIYVNVSPIAAYSIRVCFVERCGNLFRMERAPWILLEHVYMEKNYISMTLAPLSAMYFTHNNWKFPV